MVQPFNFHTHTFRCKHASGTVHDYVAAAEGAGLTHLGMSDHTPLPDGAWPESRMAMAEYPAYRTEITAARHQFPNMQVYAGLECEGNERYFSFYRDRFLAVDPLDFLVGAVHFYEVDGRMKGAWDGMDPRELAAFTRTLVTAMESGLFAYIAHPDIFAFDYPQWDDHASAASREIARAAASLGMPLEINGYGMRKPMVPGDHGPRWPYPVEPFWEIAAEEGVSAVVNSDAHRPQDIAGGLEVGLGWMERLGLKKVDLRQRISMSV